MEERKNDKLVGLALYMVMLGMLLSGSANTILMKVQNNTNGKDNIPFNHPFVQCAIMFVGELFCLGAYFAKYLYNKRQEKIDVETPATPQGDFILIDGKRYKTKINPLLLAIPACFDIVASTMMNIALTIIAASVYQMMRGMIIIFTSLMSIMFLKRRLYRHHWSSLATIFLGVFMVGLSSFLNDNSGGEGKSAGI
jgi:drug/metabolite transporter (DMT)-like permease